MAWSTLVSPTSPALLACRRPIPGRNFRRRRSGVHDPPSVGREPVLPEEVGEERLRRDEIDPQDVCGEVGVEVIERRRSKIPATLAGGDASSASRSPERWRDRGLEVLRSATRRISHEPSAMASGIRRSSPSFVDVGRDHDPAPVEQKVATFRADAGGGTGDDGEMRGGRLGASPVTRSIPAGGMGTTDSFIASPVDAGHDLLGDLFRGKARHPFGRSRSRRRGRSQQWRLDDPRD